MIKSIDLLPNYIQELKVTGVGKADTRQPHTAKLSSHISVCVADISCTSLTFVI